MSVITNLWERQQRKWDLWRVAWIVILLLAIVSRLYLLGDRAVSHDETTHAKYAWNLYTGRGFAHDPLMHGPLLFEVTAFFYALFGVSDFTARLYAALAGIALVMTPLLLRRWLGRLGALLAGVMLLIAPSISYYSRYTRHDIPIILATVLLLWTILSYLEDGRRRWLYGMAACLAVMFASKENAYIYIAIFMGLLALPFFYYVATASWQNSVARDLVLVCLVVALLAGGAFALSFRGAERVLQGEGNNIIGAVVIPWWGHVALAVVVLAGLGMLVSVYYGIGEAALAELRLFDVLLVLGTFVLPLGSAVLMKYVAGVDMPTLYAALMGSNNLAGMLGSLPAPTLWGMLLTLLFTLAISIALGLWWNRRVWPLVALLFYGVFFVFYSTFFTFGLGMLRGLIGGLAYWMSQQGEQRGSQPWYYYAVIGPLYAYLPLLLALPAGVEALRQALAPVLSPDEDATVARRQAFNERLAPRFFPLFLLVWALLSWVAYAVAGEKMPWLFVHIAFPHILLAAWAVGRWLRGLTWRDIFVRHGWVLLLALLLLWLAGSAFQSSSQFMQGLMQQGGEEARLAAALAQLEPWARLLGGAGGVLMSGGLLLWVMLRLGVRCSLQLVVLTLFLLLSLLTMRTSVLFNYVNYELPTEFLVYAHATPDVKLVLNKITEISWRLTGTPDQLQVAYSREVAWPYYWYMDTRFPNNYYFEDPTADEARLLASPVVLAAKSEWEAVEAVLGDGYRAFDYKHIWWPIEDYRDLTRERIRNALTDPELRAALWDILFYRDYRAYARLRDPENPFTLNTWPHRSETRLYVRTDLARQVWSYRLDRALGVYQASAEELASESTAGEDPYAGEVRPLRPLWTAPLPESEVRGVAVAPDGTLYVVDAAQHRIWHLNAVGEVMGSWGGYGVAPGTFNTPWGIAVDGEGYVYVADTWNHRVQKFDAQGEYVASWGRFGESLLYEPGGAGMFFGPRDVAVGPDGLLYVADTGNHRIQVFDASGNFLREFGGVGDLPGQLREPVSLAVSATGELYVGDLGNLRIQAFTTTGQVLREWPVPVWQGLARDLFPFLAVVGERVYAGDPGYGRVLLFAGGESEETGMPVVLQGEAPMTPAGLAIADGRLYAGDGGVAEATSPGVLAYPLPE